MILAKEHFGESAVLFLNWMMRSPSLYDNIICLQVRSVDVKEALRLQKENNFVILDVRPEAEFKEVFFF